MRSLREEFERYASSAVEALGRKAETERRGPVRLVTNPDREVRDAVTALEDEEPFGRLVTTTRLTFHPKPSRRDESAWRDAVQNFFRRSGFYLGAAAGQAASVDAIFARYVEAFEAGDRRVTYIAPIEHVYFERADLDFGSFRVRQFSADELATLLQTSVNRVFYEWAVTEVSPLNDYWHISLTRPFERKQLGVTLLNMADLDKVTPSFTGFPQLEEALLPLVSFPWQMDLVRHKPKEEQIWWHGFRIPFLIALDDDLLRPPPPRPDLAKLDREPYHDPTTDEETDMRVIQTHLNSEETNECEAFVGEVAARLSLLDIDSVGWQFFQRASGYLLKAFFADGLEQLLWHITTVDGLIGDDTGGATKKLAARVARILGTTAKDQEETRRTFRELYSFRSRFVHGGESEKQALTKHLREAREIARAVFVWFVAFLTHMQDVVRLHQLPPLARTDLLALIDLDVKEKAQLATVLKTSDALPDGFPAVPGWLTDTPPQRTG